MNKLFNLIICKNLLMKKNLIIFLNFLLYSSALLAQNGSISGKVTDKGNNEVLIGANVLVVGTMQGSSTDIDGHYEIKNLAPGKYQIRYSFISFQSIIVNDIIVKSGETVKLDIALSSDLIQTEEVLVTADAIKSSEGALLNIQKQSLNIVDGLSAELISKNNSSDGTDILKRMTGVTISEGKYAYVRGVGDRYNNTLLNGSSLPSTDPEKKSFSYDLFPASLVENILTSKTFTPDKPADFSGGLVEINTVEFPEKFILNIDLGTSYNSVTNFKNFSSYNGGSKDWLGYDDGTRSLPSYITNTKVGRSNYSADELINIGQSFKNDWQTNYSNTPLNGNLKINLGQRFNLSANDVLGYIASVNYSNSYNTQQIEKNNYTFEGPRYLYDGFNYSHSVSLGALLNISYKFAQKHKISFKNVLNRNADDETTFYEGDYLYNPDYRQISSLRYVSRSLYSSQVIGEHHFDLFNGIDFNWNANYASSERDEPDARRYVYLRSYDDVSEPLRFQLDQSLATRFFGNLNDENLGFGSDLNLKIFENPNLPKFKLGYHYDYKDRIFDARTFGFKNLAGGNFAYEDSVIQSGVNNIFAQENFGNKFIEVSEITKPSDSYKSNQDVYAFYLMTNFDLFSIKFVAGFRNENSIQKLNSETQTGELVKINHSYNDLLPSINVNYPFTETMNFRLGYSKTLARPEFRELAPFSYYDFISAELVQGNTELKRSLIDNYDFRFELFPGPRELFALGIFYKDFKDPIEQILIATSGFEPTRSYSNAKRAKNYGVEFELRKNIDFIGELFNDFSFVGNLSFIKSKIEIEANGFQVSERPLQGQADFILNLGLYYDDFKNGYSASLIYNKVGEKISKVGFANLGDIIELPRDQVDFSISKNILENLSLKLTAKDILSQNHVFMQRTTEGDKIAEKIIMGRGISLSFGYNF